jgi:chaperone required for assembly of F1-ATPase
VTRAANSAIDKVTPQYDAVVAMLADYAGTDLLSYRATEPAELVTRQAAAWDPLLDWAEQRYGARLTVTSGVIPVAQDPAALAALHEALWVQGPYRVTALHDLIAISGSMIIGLALGEGAIDLDTAWRASRVDEHWQTEQWGPDEEAAEIEAIKRDAMQNALRLLDLLAA